MEIQFIAKRFWLPLFLALLSLFSLDISLGSVYIPFAEILNILAGKNPVDETWSSIIFNFRLTKAITCIVAGAALAVGGLQMQTLFRNPLAGPDVFGLSSGASLAVSLVFMASNIGIGLSTGSSPWIVALFASLGSGFVSLLVVIISNRVRDHSSLLIIGLMIGAGTGSVVSVLQYMSPAEDQQSYLIWTFGNMGGLNWNEIIVLTIIFMLGISLSLLTIKSLNVWALGENYNKSLGINTGQSRLLIIISTSILTGGVTAFCGPIAFVGLAVPHLTKILVKNANHNVLLPAVMVSGASLMLFCDVLAQLPGTSHILPINAITALIGAPVVIWVIMRRRKISNS